MPYKDKEKGKERKAEYYLAHKEEKKTYRKKYNLDHKNKIIERQAKYRAEHKEKITVYRSEHKKEIKAYQTVNKEEIKVQNAKRYLVHKEEVKKASAKYRAEHKEETKEYKIKYRLEHKEEINTYKREYFRQRILIDSLFKIAFNLRARTRIAFNRMKLNKPCKTKELLGADWETVMRHIESQFIFNMSWEKVGKEIHIDHKIPLAKAKTEKQLIKLCHYTNLQPLWAEDNLSKGSKLNYTTNLMKAA